MGPRCRALRAPTPPPTPTHTQPLTAQSWSTGSGSVERRRGLGGGGTGGWKTVLWPPRARRMGGGGAARGHHPQEAARRDECAWAHGWRHAGTAGASQASAHLVGGHHVDEDHQVGGTRHVGGGLQRGAPSEGEAAGQGGGDRAQRAQRGVAPRAMPRAAKHGGDTGPCRRAPGAAGGTQGKARIARAACHHVLPHTPFVGLMSEAVLQKLITYGLAAAAGGQRWGEPQRAKRGAGSGCRWHPRGPPGRPCSGLVGGSRTGTPGPVPARLRSVHAELSGPSARSVPHRTAPRTHTPGSPAPTPKSKRT